MKNSSRPIYLLPCTLILLLALILTGCNNNNPQNDTQATLTSSLEASSTLPIKTQVNISALKGPTSLGLVKLMADAEEELTENDYNFTLAGAADEVSVGLINGSLDIAAIPANLASVLYNRTEGGLTALAINTLGVLYVIENGSSINEVTDLIGQTIYSTGKGTTPEYALNFVLNKNNIDEADVNIEFLSEAAEVAASLAQGVAAIAVLPEPLVTSVLNQNPDLRIALDLTKEWDKVRSETDGVLVTGIYVVRTAFLEENPETVASFLREAEASIAFTSTSPEETANLIVKYGIVPAAPIALKALPNCNIVFRSGERMFEELSGYLKVLYEANPSSIGGNLPDAEFYYQK